MVFQGEILSVGALLDAARAASAETPSPEAGIRHTAAQNAAACRTLVAEGEGLDACWRFGILQTMDDYTSVLRRGGPDLASQVFKESPPRTGAEQLDAAFAALAEYLAVQDGWQVPEWASDPDRSTSNWYPAVPVLYLADAERESPDAFRRRGILITSRSLARA